MSQQSKPATSLTTSRNAEVAESLSLDSVDFERAKRGLIAQHKTGVIEAPFGTVWDINKYEFLQDGEGNALPAPDSVNPSLWRQAQLNYEHGLFKVDDGLWQARGYDISNITFIEGDEGWIIIDPLTTDSTARACLELANAELGERPVTAVIYTHSHADHFGGVHGVTSVEDVEAGKVRIIAPEGFMHEAVAENVIAGQAMGRRSAYQFGPLLAPGERGHVDSGLGKAIPFAPPGLLAPTESITHTGEELVVDGVRIIFQFTPDAEAPAEMTFFFPDRGWLCMAENCSHNMHNLVPIRGAQVRDTLSWSKYIDEALEMFGPDTDIMFASHHWPRWGREDINGFLGKQRDLYRWIHDQTMRRANKGETGIEIAETLELPPQFMSEGHTRGYYGTLVHNVKAVYARYLSFYDGNPANLWSYPPVESGTRYVEFMGGADNLLKNARRTFAEGDYRWVVQVVNHLIFADPTNIEARELQADAYEQLGYGSESATWRNAYLTGAQELRHGAPEPRPARRSSILMALDIEQIFDTIAVRLVSENVNDDSVLIRWNFTDIDQQWLLRLSHGALTARQITTGSEAAPTLTLTLQKAAIVRVLSKDATFVDLVSDGSIQLEGDPAGLQAIFTNLDTFMSSFPIVEP